MTELNRIKRNLLALLNSITVLGAGSETFDRQIHALRSLHAHAKEYENDIGGTIVPYEHDNWLGHSAITASTTFFSPKPRDCEMSSIPFGAGEDPNGVLANILSSNTDLRHGDDNEVHYLEANPARGGSK